MKRGILWAALAGLLLFVPGCASRPRQSVFEKSAVPLIEQSEPYQIFDYKSKDQGGEIPPWVTQYLETGLQGVEKLPQYEGKYTFVGRNSGTNSRILQQWLDSFTVDQDFPRLAAVRLEARLSRTAASYPDDEYGNFYIMAVRAASDAIYRGAVREDDFWMLRQDFEQDGTREELDPGIGRQIYDCMILVSIEKSLLEIELNGILNGINPQPSPTRDQVSSIHRVKDNFFDGF